MSTQGDWNAHQLEIRDHHAQQLAEIIIRRFAAFHDVPTQDAAGNLVLGWERRMREWPLSPEEGDYLLRQQLKRVHKAMMENTFPLLKANEARIAVVLHLCVVLGVQEVKQMHMFWACMRNEDYDGAADQVLLSMWPQFVGNEPRDKHRAIEMIYSLRTGKVKSKKDLL